MQQEQWTWTQGRGLARKGTGASATQLKSLTAPGEGFLFENVMNTATALNVCTLSRM